jgi:hypothetical protein
MHGLRRPLGVEGRDGVRRLRGILLPVGAQDWTMEKCCNNYFMAFTLSCTLGVVIAMAVKQHRHDDPAKRLSGRNSFDSASESFLEANLRSRQDELSTLHKRHKCEQLVCAPPETIYGETMPSKKFSFIYASGASLELRIEFPD